MIVPIQAPTEWTAADVVREFGPIPLRRIRSDPAPGTATEEDVLRIHQTEKRLYELVDGVLVEKTMGYSESYLACLLIQLLNNHVVPRNLGIVAGEAGMLRLTAGQIRIPDVSFISWDRIPGRRLPRGPIPDLVPNLAVEVLSTSNTVQEMDRKLRDYFAAGVQLVWYVDPVARTVTVYTAADQGTILGADQTLDGGNVLPGFTLSLAEFFKEPTGPSQ